jgi:hypothetical protein
LVEVGITNKIYGIEKMIEEAKLPLLDYPLLVRDSTFR